MGNHTGNQTGNHTGNHIPAGGGGGGGVENEFMKEEIHHEGLKKGRERLDSPTSIATHIYSTNIGIENQDYNCYPSSCGTKIGAISSMLRKDVGTVFNHIDAS